MVDSARSAALHGTALLAAVTHAANNCPITRYDDNGHAVTATSRDSTDRPFPRVARETRRMTKAPPRASFDARELRSLRAVASRRMSNRVATKRRRLSISSRPQRPSPSEQSRQSLDADELQRRVRFLCSTAERTTAKPSSLIDDTAAREGQQCPNPRIDTGSIPCETVDTLPSASSHIGQSQRNDTSSTVGLASQGRGGGTRTLSHAAGDVPLQFQRPALTAMNSADCFGHATDDCAASCNNHAAARDRSAARSRPVGQSQSSAAAANGRRSIAGAIARLIGGSARGR